MNDLTKQIQLIFVVETNEIVKSDTAYIVWLLKKTYSAFISENECDSLFITYDFVYMDGKANFNKQKISKDIRYLKYLFRHGISYVIYCIDLDNKGKDEKALTERIKDHVKKNHYYLIAFYREIEDVFHLPISGTKKERVQFFTQHYPKKDSVDSKCLCCSINNLLGKNGYTNFNNVINKIIEDNKSEK